MRHSLPIVLIGALCLAAGCSKKTSDRDLEWVTPYQGMDVLGKATGVFGSRGDTVTPTSY